MARRLPEEPLAALPFRNRETPDLSINHLFISSGILIYENKRFGARFSTSIVDCTLINATAISMRLSTRTIQLLCCVVLASSAEHGANHKAKRPLRDASANNNQTSTEGSNCNSRAYFDRLEAHMDERLNGVRREIWTNARNIEQATKAAVSNLRRDVSGSPGPDTETERQLQVVIATLRLLAVDLEALKLNISQIANATALLHSKSEIDENIREVFQTSPSDNSQQPQPAPSSCLELKRLNQATPSGVYLVQPKGTAEPFMAHCEMDFQGGGWLTIHNRISGDQDFYKDWQEYKVGFGNLAGEHWLGLEKIFQLTGREINELAVQLMDVNNARTSARYDLFSIGSESEGYALKVLGSYEGSAGDSLSYHAGSKFSSRDKDQDDWVEGNCAQSHGGAWWYKSCDKSNLNGRYYPGDLPELYMYQSMYWDTFGGPLKGLKYARMMIRPKQ